ncbi:TIR domain-containing protein [Candidatus Bacteroides intestinigallinarum]|uniref:TIR domain-containing protein n=1 Tax=Candidatus Bacteroides intestinigallinarum TaxID=2838470 RepID=UPI002166760A|nr:TIR domain-containing protein [Candidatus Bacteroides intestinigallinarum]MCS3202868.1 TIR domain-containing protein [Candidatus Bacteroides intestinigallinarum]
MPMTRNIKEGLVSWAEKNKVFIDGSVDMGEIPEDWDDQKIREYIRDEHLKDTTVTILLVGTETKNRKHIDWELYSSMYDGTVNKKSGIIVILLPSVKSEYYTCAHSSEKTFYPETTQWMSIDSREEYHRRYPYLPERIIDNLLEPNAFISVINWDKLTPDILRQMIDNAYNSRATCTYDLSRPMRKKKWISRIIDYGIK